MLFRELRDSKSFESNESAHTKNGQKNSRWESIPGAAHLAAGPAANSPRSTKNFSGGRQFRPFYGTTSKSRQAPLGRSAERSRRTFVTSPWNHPASPGIHSAWRRLDEIKDSTALTFRNRCGNHQLSGSRIHPAWRSLDEVHEAHGMPWRVRSHAKMLHEGHR